MEKLHQIKKIVKCHVELPIRLDSLFIWVYIGQVYKSLWVSLYDGVYENEMRRKFF